MLFADLLSLHLVTFLMFSILVYTRKTSDFGKGLEGTQALVS